MPSSVESVVTLHRSSDPPYYRTLVGGEGGYPLETSSAQRDESEDFVGIVADMLNTYPADLGQLDLAAMVRCVHRVRPGLHGIR